MSGQIDYYKAAVWLAVLLSLAVFWGAVIYVASGSAATRQRPCQIIVRRIEHPTRTECHTCRRYGWCLGPVPARGGTR